VNSLSPTTRPADAFIGATIVAAEGMIIAMDITLAISFFAFLCI
jgi:hypothetical protein